MNILLISPDANDIRRVPLGIGYLASSISFLRPDCTVRLMSKGSDETTESFFVRLKNFTPDIVGITVLTGAVQGTLQLCSSIRERYPKAVLIAGGFHGTLFPDELIGKEHFDAVLSGEAEHTFPHLIAATEQGAQLSSVSGLITPHLKQASQNRHENLNALAFPRREEHGHHPRHGTMTCISTTRGCPHSCVFCTYPEVYGQTERRRDVRNVMAELTHCKHKLGISTFWFTDANFTSSSRRTSTLCTQLIPLNIQWICQTNPKTLVGPENATTEMLALMKKAGCVEIMLGIESGSDKVLRAMRKSHTRDDVELAVQRIQNAGIEVTGLFVIGCLEETQESVAETVEFAKSLNLDEAYFGQVEPFPGSELYSIAVKKEYLSQPHYWRSVSYQQSTRNHGMELPTLSAEQAKNLTDWARKKYLLAPKRILRRGTHLIRNPRKFWSAARGAITRLRN